MGTAGPWSLSLAGPPQPRSQYTQWAWALRALETLFCASFCSSVLDVAWAMPRGCSTTTLLVPTTAPALTVRTEGGTDPTPAQHAPPLEPPGDKTAWNGIILCFWYNWKFLFNYDLFSAILDSIHYTEIWPINTLKGENVAPKIDFKRYIFIYICIFLYINIFWIYYVGYTYNLYKYILYYKYIIYIYNLYK